MEELYGLIGGNLLDIYIKHFGFSETDAREAVKIYRQRYAKVGIHKAHLYPGFKDLLVALKKAGVNVGIATLKAEVFATLMVEELGVSEFFDCICGMDNHDGLTKVDLIRKCMNEIGCNLGETVLIGDTVGDCKGAESAGVEFIGITYGFGFSKEKPYKFQCCDTCDELKNIILEIRKS